MKKTIIFIIIFLCVCKKTLTQVNPTNDISAHFTNLNFFNFELDIYAGLEPEIGIAFHYMGTKANDSSIDSVLQVTLNELNTEVRNKVQFRLDTITANVPHKHLPEVYKSIMSASDSITNLIDGIDISLRNVIKKRKVKNIINVYILETYPETINNEIKILNGFSLVDNDIIFMSHTGFSQNTLAHEIGHILGLKHPWEMTKEELERLGLSKEKVKINHMNYDTKEHEFTIQQLNYTKIYLILNKRYLWTNKKHQGQF